jgi:ribosomal protein S18 acetylase RimI-like enzyme
VVTGMNNVATGKQPEVSTQGAGHVRDARPADAEQIADVHVRSWQAAYHGLLPQEYLDRLDPADRLPRWRRTLDETDRTAGGVLVAVADGEVCGAAWFGPSCDPDADPEQVGELAGIYLLAEAWGQGLGRSLMATATERLAAAGYAQATLWVLESNARARRFYRRAGWTEDGAVKQDDRLGFPITEVRYRRRLSPETTVNARRFPAPALQSGR